MKNSKRHFLVILLVILTIGCKKGADPITVTVNNFTVTIDENPTAGQSLGTINGTTSSGNITFTITSQTPAGAFAINASTGQLTVANASLFDFEANTTLTATITAANGNITATGTVTVTLNNLPDAVSAMDATVSLDENPNNAQAVATVSATTDAGTLTYSFSSQTPAGAFALDAATGALTVDNQALFDFETNPTLTAVVTASNGTVSDNGTITVNLNNLLEVLTTQDETLTIDENPSNGQALVTVSATTDMGSASFAIVNESVNGAFAIDMNSGALTVANPLLFDYEQNTSLTATVNVTNGSLAATSLVTVNLNDLFEIAWTQQSASVGFGAIYSHEIVEFKGKLWATGGIRGITRIAEAWSSSDGINWTQAAPTGNIFSPRNGHQAVVFNNKLWIIGGFTDNGRTNEIWSTPDGTTWALETINGGIFSARADHTSIVFDSKIWVIGGSDGNFLNEIWNSVDGTTWNQVTPGTIFPGRQAHTLTFFNNKLWVIGGTNFDGQGLQQQLNDIWSSTDGINWTQSTVSGNHFSPRWLHGTISHNNLLWVIGGTNDNTSENNEVWTSPDGITWTQRMSTTIFDERSNFALFSFANFMWVSGGSNQNGILADIWKSN